MSLRPRKINFEPTWLKIHDTIKSVMTCSDVQKEVWYDRFHDVYEICVANPTPLGEPLYERTKKFLHEYVAQLYAEVTGSTDILSTYHGHWQKYSSGSTYINELYRFMNTQVIGRTKHIAAADHNYGFGIHDSSQLMVEIEELALTAWRNKMIDPLKDQLQVLLLAAVDNDRLMGVCDDKVVKGVVTSFVEVERKKGKHQLLLYQNLFEEKYLMNSEMFYQKEANALYSQNTCTVYMEKVLLLIDEEKTRCRRLVHSSSYDCTSRICYMKMVGDYSNFLNEEAAALIEQEQRENLSRLYVLLINIKDGVKHLVSLFLDNLKKVGEEIVQSLPVDNQALQFVEKMLDFHGKYCALIKDIFMNDQTFLEALDRACIYIVNWRSPGLICKSPELLARYCDILLKKSSKNAAESEIDDKLSNSITIFRYLDDKDIYQRYYSQKLAKRLIHGMSISKEAEESMINKLKLACGYEFTSKLHRMFTDMTINEDLNRKFTASLKEKEVKLGTDFAMLVLQQGVWPIGQNKISMFSMPHQLQLCISQFEDFYDSFSKGRKLTWLHNLATVDLKCKLEKQYLVNMSAYHCAILLSFNDSLCHTIDELCQSTQLSIKDLNRTVVSLLESKIITSQTLPDELDEFSVLNVNLKLMNKRTRFRIQMVGLPREAVQEVERTQKQVEDDRRFIIQAIIVRVMKARRSLKHNLLIQEVIQQCRTRFQPSISVIKKCIESLIDKQYICRDKIMSDEYNYVA